MARSVVLVVALAASACGRVSFDHRDAGTDSELPIDTRVCVAPVGHDEDGDSFDDACDPCPYVDDVALDADGDLVGDDCDPNPALSTERWIEIETFETSDTTRWTFPMSTTVANDKATFAAVGQSRALRSKRDTDPLLGMETLRFDFDVTAVGTGQVQLSVGVSDSAVTRWYFCELTDDVVELLTLGYTLDGVNYTTVASIPIPPIVSGRGRLEARISPSLITCTATWAEQDFTVSGAPPSGSFGRPYFAVNNMNLELRSAGRIGTTQ